MNEMKAHYERSLEETRLKEQQKLKKDLADKVKPLEELLSKQQSRITELELKQSQESVALITAASSQTSDLQKSLATKERAVSKLNDQLSTANATIKQFEQQILHLSQANANLMKEMQENLANRSMNSSYMSEQRSAYNTTNEHQLREENRILSEQLVILSKAQQQYQRPQQLNNNPESATKLVELQEQVERLMRVNQKLLAENLEKSSSNTNNNNNSDQVLQLKAQLEETERKLRVSESISHSQIEELKEQLEKERRSHQAEGNFHQQNKLRSLLQDQVISYEQENQDLQKRLLESASQERLNQSFREDEKQSLLKEISQLKSQIALSSSQLLTSNNNDINTRLREKEQQVRDECTSKIQQLRDECSSRIQSIQQDASIKHTQLTEQHEQKSLRMKQEYEQKLSKCESNLDGLRKRFEDEKLELINERTRMESQIRFEVNEENKRRSATFDSSKAEEIKSLRDSISQLEGTIRMLRNSLSELTDSKERLATQLSDSQRTLEAEKSVHARELSRLKERITTCESERDNATEELRRAKIAVSGAQDSQQSSNRLLSQENTFLKAEVNRLTEDLSKKKADIERTLANSRASIESCQSVLKEKELVMATMSARISTLEDELEHAQLNAKNALSQKNEASAQLSQLMIKNERLGAMCLDDQQKRETNENAIRDFEDRIEELQELTRTTEDSKTILMNKLRNIEIEKANIERQAENEKKELELALANLSNQVRMNQAELAEKAQFLVESQKEKQIEIDAKNTANQIAEKLKQQNSHLMQSTIELTEQLQRLQDEVDMNRSSSSSHNTSFSHER